MVARLMQEFLTLPPWEQAGHFVWPSLQGAQLLPEERALFAKYKPGGVVLFRRNFTSLEQAAQLIEEVKSAVGPRRGGFVVAIDEEGGRVSRLPKPFPRGEPALSFAPGDKVQELRDQVWLQGAVAKSLGVNTILAPVADVLSEPTNPALGDRCFSTTAAVAAERALTVWESLQRQGLLGCAKHFPGHGNTTTDSHVAFAQSGAPLDTLRAREWLPFRTLFQARIPLCMTAHVLVPSLDPHLPATLSSRVLTHFLRQELGFEGVIVSDDMRMEAIAAHYRKLLGDPTLPTAAILPRAAQDALEAGCDVVLACHSIGSEVPILEALAQRLEADISFRGRRADSAVRLGTLLTPPA